jgi:hypothetical protein
VSIPFRKELMVTDVLLHHKKPTKKSDTFRKGQVLRNDLPTSCIFAHADTASALSRTRMHFILRHEKRFHCHSIANEPDHVTRKPEMHKTLCSIFMRESIHISHSFFRVKLDSSRKNVSTSSSHVHKACRVGLSLHVGAVQVAM